MFQKDLCSGDRITRHFIPRDPCFDILKDFAEVVDFIEDMKVLD